MEYTLKTIQVTTASILPLCCLCTASVLLMMSLCTASALLMMSLSTATVLLMVSLCTATVLMMMCPSVLCLFRTVRSPGVQRTVRHLLSGDDEGGGETATATLARLSSTEMLQQQQRQQQQAQMAHLASARGSSSARGSPPPTMLGGGVGGNWGSRSQGGAGVGTRGSMGAVGSVSPIVSRQPSPTAQQEGGGELVDRTSASPKAHRLRTDGEMGFRQVLGLWGLWVKVLGPLSLGF